MANIAVIESSSNSFLFGGVQSDVAMKKRKTALEPRVEQLKRRNGEIQSDGQMASLLNSDNKISVGSTSGLKKNDSSKVPKYVNSRVDEVYPIKKSSERCRVLYGKENLMDPKISKWTNGATGSSGGSTVVVSSQSLHSCGKAEVPNTSDGLGKFRSLISADEVGKNDVRKIEKCSQNAFQSIGELHYGKEKPSDFATAYMQKAMKGFAVRDFHTSSSSLADSGKHGDVPPIFPSSNEFSISGHSAPLDFTLKTTLRLVSSSSVRWCHRLSASPATIGVSQFTSQSCYKNDQKFGCASGASRITGTVYSNALCSWIYPQSSLPTTIIAAMTLSTAREEKDFLSRRQQDWEDSFRSLYYMLRKSICNIFYVCTKQFVVMFTGGNFSGKKRSCNAYLSQSTLGLRSLLKKNGISFSMPLSCAEVEQAADDNLAELSEIKKQNLGQTVHMDSMSDVDNSPKSLLAFIGNENAHSLYDFLLNYRFSMNSFAGVDVPVLYAPVPFQNSSLSVPEVRCKEMKKADAALPSSSGSDAVDTEVSIEASIGSSGASICYSIEIEDTILPPWIVCGVCAAMSSDGRSFEASFTTESSSAGLNVALDSICQASDLPIETTKSQPETVDALGIPQAIPSPHLRSASLCRLRYSNACYKAYVNPL